MDFSRLGGDHDLGLGRLSHGLGLQQDLVPGLGRKTYPGCLGLGCDKLIISQSIVESQQ